MGVGLVEDQIVWREPSWKKTKDESLILLVKPGEGRICWAGSGVGGEGGGIESCEDTLSGYVFPSIITHTCF